jgi:VIT1/CCC1 family predicted Fe2+/Mn2+ transporter
MNRGLDRQLAMQVARQLSEHDRLGAHLRDELGITEKTRARPLQAAWISAISFAVFALVPVLALLVAPATLRMATIGAVTITSLAALGALGGYLGGAPMLRAALRVTVGGALAMGVTGLVGHLFGITVA